jgi:hypothetical protein
MEGLSIMSNMINVNLTSEKSQFVDYLNKIKEAFETRLNEFKSTRFFKEKDLRTILYLGALLNNTTYRQQKFYQTGSIPKEVIILFKIVSYQKAKFLWKKCKRLQNSIAKTKHIPRTFLYEKVDDLLSNLKEGDWVSDPEDLSLAMISGYNLYSMAILDTFGKKNINPPVYEKIWHYDGYEKNYSFQLGFLSALFIFRVIKKQIRDLKTSSLNKFLKSYIRNPNLRNLRKILRETNSIILKIFTTNISKIPKNDINTFLPYDNIQLDIFKYIAEDTITFRDEDLFLGFITGFLWEDCLKYSYKEKDIFEDIGEPKTISVGGKNIVTEDHYVNQFKKMKFRNKAEKVAFLLGILFQTTNHEEKLIVKTGRLDKRLNVLFRHFVRKSIQELYMEIYKTYIYLWSDQIEKSLKISRKNVNDIKYFQKLNKIRVKLVKLIGTLPERVDPNEVIISFIQGYESFFRLFRKINR